MPDPLRVPGYRVERLAGVGGSGDVWVAQEEATGRRVALKRLHGAGPDEREALRREGALLATVRHPHVLGVRGLLETSTDLVLVLDLADGGSLADVVARRGALSPGELVTAVAPVAEALAAVHRAGLVHGDVTPANILFTRDGRPLLADLGVARVLGVRPSPSSATAAYAAPEVLRGEPPTPASDVFGLASAAAAALTGDVPDALGAQAAERLASLPEADLAVLDRALSRRPDRRPTAGVLADALFRVALPAPVDLAVPAEPVVPLGDEAELQQVTRRVVVAAAAPDVPPSPPAPRSVRHAAAAHAARAGHRTRSLPRRLVVGVAVTAVLAALVVLATTVLPAWLRDHPPATRAVAAGPAAPSASTSVSASASESLSASESPSLIGGPACATASAAASPAPAAVEVDWAEVVRDLYAARAAAFADADPAGLCGVYAPGSPGLRTDLATLARYRDQGLRPRGLAADVVAVRLERADEAGAVVEVTDRLDAYELVDEDGEVRARESALPEQQWRAALVHLGDGWRFG